MNKSPPTESPCIGICSTVYGDNICRGCKRHYLEVIDWNRYDDQQKQHIHQRLEAQIESVVSRFIIITDSKILKAELNKVMLRPPLYANPFYWTYELLRLHAQQMNDLEAYGLRAKPPYHTLSANGLFTQIDDQIYAYAVATTVARS